MAKSVLTNRLANSTRVARVSLRTKGSSISASRDFNPVVFWNLSVQEMGAKPTKTKPKFRCFCQCTCPPKMKEIKKGITVATQTEEQKVNVVVAVKEKSVSPTQPSKTLKKKVSQQSKGTKKKENHASKSTEKKEDKKQPKSKKKEPTLATHLDEAMPVTAIETKASDKALKDDSFAKREPIQEKCLRADETSGYADNTEDYVTIDRFLVLDEGSDNNTTSTANDGCETARKN